MLLLLEKDAIGMTGKKNTLAKGIFTSDSCRLRNIWWQNCVVSGNSLHTIVSQNIFVAIPQMTYLTHLVWSTSLVNIASHLNPDSYVLEI